MNGVDPVDYYSEHPIKNKVVTQGETHLVVFEPKAKKLSMAETMRFAEAVSDKSMQSVQEVVIDMDAMELGNKARRDSLSRMFRRMGYIEHNLRFERSDALVANQALIHISYAVVVPPDCPDWRMSPSHNYSNSDKANFGCATEVNLGQMVADPRDLVRGSGELPPALSEPGDRAIRTYRTGPAASSSAAATGGPVTVPAAAGGDTTSVAPAAAPQ
jgi:pilus assembly protein CpaD